MAELEEHLPCEDAAVDLLGPDSLEDLLPQLLHLLEEFFPQLIVLQFLDILEVLLLLRRPDHGEAVLLTEIIADEPPDFILLLYGI